MQRFKVSDEVEVIGLGSHGFYIGQNVRIVSDLSPNGFYNCNPMNGRSSYYVEESNLKLINSNNMELKITKERILAAAAKCSTAKSTLETLFPEAFEKEFVTADEFFINKGTINVAHWGSIDNADMFINLDWHLVKLDDNYYRFEKKCPIRK